MKAAGSLGLVALAAVAFAADAPEWWVRAAGAEKTLAVRPDGAERRDLPHAPRSGPAGVASPDGTRVAYVRTDDGDAEIWVADADGKNPRRLTENGAIDNQPSWSPDGKRIAFGSTRSGKWQVHVMDADGSNARALTDRSEGAWMPKYASDGRIAYLGWVKAERSKLPPKDLVVTDGKKHETILESTGVVDFAWSPDAKRIAVSWPGMLAFVEVGTRERREVAFSKIQPDLYSHGASDLAWRPDGGAVACRIRFLGGRLRVEGEEESKMFGDDEAFVVPLEGKTTWFTLAGKWELGWIAAADLPPAPRER